MATEEASLQAAREEAARLISALSASGGNGAVELLKQIEGMSKRRRAEIDEELADEQLNMRSSAAWSELPSPSTPTAVPADMARRVSDLQANVQNAPSQLKGAVQPRFMTASLLSPINSPTPSDKREMAIPGDVEAGAGGSADVAAIQQIATRMPPRRSTISGSPSFQNLRALKDAPPETGGSPTGAGSNDAGDVENTRGPLEQLRSNGRSHSIHIMRNKSADFANSAYSDLKRAAPVALRAKLESLGDRMADMFEETASHAEDIVNAVWFDRSVTAAIVAVGIVTYVDIEASPAQRHALNPTLNAISITTLTVFTLELFLKVLARGWAPLDYFLDPREGYYNTFDALVVLLSYVFLNSQNRGTISILRLVRLMRVMNQGRGLRVILKGLGAGLSSVLNIMLVLMLLIYLWAVAGVTLFQQNDPVHFGSVPVAMLTLFRVATFADWKDVFYINTYGCDRYLADMYIVQPNMTEPRKFDTRYGTFYQFDCVAPVKWPMAAGFYFVSYTLVAGFVIISLFVGVITMGMFNELRDEKEFVRAKQHEQQKRLAEDSLAALTSEIGSSQRLRRSSDGLGLGSLGSSNNISRKRARGTDLRTDLRRCCSSFIDECYSFFGSSTEERKRNTLNRHSMAMSDHLDAAFGVNDESDGGAIANGLTDRAHRRPSPRKSAYARFAKRCAIVSESNWFSGAIVFAIVALGIIIGMQTDGLDPTVASVQIFEVIDVVALGLFTAEIAVKVIAEGNMPLNFLHDSWNAFDLFVVMLSFAMLATKISYVPIIRMVRLFRVLKLVRRFPQLRIIVDVFIQMARPVYHTMLIFAVMNYIFAVIGVIAFRTNDPQHFGNIPTAMMTVWLCETLDDWEQVLYINMFGCDRYGYYHLPTPFTPHYVAPTIDDALNETTAAAAPSGSYPWGHHLGARFMAKECEEPTAFGWAAAAYFVMLVIYGAIVLPTVLISLVSVAFEHQTQRSEEEALVEAQVDDVVEQAREWFPHVDFRSALKRLRIVFDMLDFDNTGSLDFEEARPFLKYIIRAYLSERLSNAQMRLIFSTVLDVDDSSTINFAEFIWFVFSIRLRFERRGAAEIDLRKGKAQLEESLQVVGAAGEVDGSKAEKIGSSGNEDTESVSGQLSGRTKTTVGSMHRISASGGQMDDASTTSFLAKMEVLEESLARCEEEQQLDDKRSVQRQESLMTIKAQVRELVFSNRTHTANSPKQFDPRSAFAERRSFTMNDVVAARRLSESRIPIQPPSIRRGSESSVSQPQPQRRPSDHRGGRRSSGLDHRLGGLDQRDGKGSAHVHPMA